MKVSPEATGVMGEENVGIYEIPFSEAIEIIVFLWHLESRREEPGGRKDDFLGSSTKTGGACTER